MTGRENEFARLMKIWVRIMNKMNDAESVKRDYGTGDLLTPAEIHMVQAIGDRPGINVTDLASRLGVTKGAVSQMVNKLAAKRLVVRYSDVVNNKEVLLKLTESGEIAHLKHDMQHAMFIGEVGASLRDISDEQVLILEKFLGAIENCLDDFSRREG